MLMGRLYSHRLFTIRLIQTCIHFHLCAIFFIFCVFEVSADLEVACRSEVQLVYGNGDGNASEGVRSVDYSVEEDTRACDAAYSALVASAGTAGGGDVIPPCDEADLDVAISSIAVLPNGSNHLPFVALNVSVLVHANARHVFMRLQCVDAPNHEDPLCHDHEEQIQKWGRMIWPCRSISVKESQSLRLPYRFSYPCFHMVGYSHYLVNISLAPNLCTSLYMVTIPLEVQLHSSIAHFYSHGAVADTDWSPLVIVDLTPTDGVWIRYARPSDRSVKQMTFAIYEKRDGSSRFVFAESVDAPDSGFKWTNVPAGNYAAVVYVDRHDCQLVCESNNAPGCRICAHTLAKFAIQEDKFTVAWRNIRAVANFAKVAAVILLVVIGGAAIVMLVLFVYARRAAGRGRAVERELVLSARPTVLILYADDSPEHTECVTLFAQHLAQHANAHIFIDVEQLNSPGMIPTRWLVDTFAKVNFVIFIFSEGAEAMLRGERLLPRRPFPELFDTAINHAICELDRFISARGSVIPRPFHSRILFAHFSYSPLSVIPTHIAAFPVRVFLLPTQIGQLIAILHEQSPENEVIHEASTMQLERAIDNVLRFRRENPQWLSERIAPPDSKETADAESISLEAIEVREPLVLPTAEQQQLLAAEHHIEPPDEILQPESGVGDEDTQFALIGSPDDLSDSDSE